MLAPPRRPCFGEPLLDKPQRFAKRALDVEFSRVENHRVCSGLERCDGAARIALIAMADIREHLGIIRGFTTFAELERTALRASLGKKAPAAAAPEAAPARKAAKRAQQEEPAAVPVKKTARRK